VHKTTDNDQMAKMDKMGEAAQTMSGTTQNSAYTAIDYALKTQEMNTKLLQQSSQAWIEGFRYQAKLSQSMAQVFFGQWGNALASMKHVALPVQRQSRSEVSEPATNGTQKNTEPAAEETQKSTKIAAKDAQETQKSTEIAAKDAQKNTETATFPIEGYDEMNVEEVSERLDGLSVDELKRVRKYEKANKGRGSLRKEMKQKIKTQGDVAEDKSTS
jgi:stalled ribosome alternative rescue factor ArfA